MRAPGRQGVPASFGRERPPEQDAFTVQGGQAFHVALHADVTPSAESLKMLFEAVRDTTRQAVLAGYADAFAEMDTAVEEPPGGGDGGAPPGEPSTGG